MSFWGGLFIGVIFGGIIGYFAACFIILGGDDKD